MEFSTISRSSESWRNTINNMSPLISRICLWSFDTSVCWCFVIASVKFASDFLPLFLPAQCCASVILSMALSVSVYLSVTSQSCTRIAKCRFKQTIPRDSPWKLVFSHQWPWWNLNRVSPSRGAKCMRGTLKPRFATREVSGSDALPPRLVVHWRSDVQCHQRCSTQSVVAGLEAKFYCRCILANDDKCIQSRDTTLEFCSPISPSSSS